MFLVALLCATIVYIVLQTVDDRRSQQKAVQQASTGKRVVLFLCILAVTASVVYWWMGSQEQVTHQGQLHPTLDEQMIQSIREDVHCGGAPF